MHVAERWLLSTTLASTSLLRGVVALVVVGLALQSASAQEPPFVGQNSYQNNWMSDAGSAAYEGGGSRGQALGMQFRTGHITGPAIGRDESLTHMELMPYSFIGNSILFGDLRGFRSNNGDWGANMGLGYRYWVGDWDRIFGVNFYHTYDETQGGDSIFRDMGFGIETLGKHWDARMNAYFPVGNRENLLGTGFVDGSQRFVGNQLFFDLTRTAGLALRGVDAEIGVPVPGQHLEDHNVRGYAGFYHYQNGAIRNLWGWKARLQGDVIPSVQASLEITNDQIFDTSAIFQIAWTLGGFRQDPSERPSQFGRMTEPVRRNYNVVVARTTTVVPDQIAVDPNTNTPYFIVHVSNSATSNPLAGDGTFENPYEQISQRLLRPNRSLTFVHANSLYNGADAALTLVPNERILGDGRFVATNPATEIRTILDVVGVDGGLILPPATTEAVRERPILRNAPGVGVTLANNTRFGGFIIDRPAGVGILADTIQSSTVLATEVLSPGDDGIFVRNSTGQIRFVDSLVDHTGAIGSAFHVDGGTANIVFLGDNNGNANTRNRIGEIRNNFRNTADGVPAPVIVAEKAPAVLIENLGEGSTGRNRGLVSVINAEVLDGSAAFVDPLVPANGFAARNGGGVVLRNNFGRISLNELQLFNTNAAAGSANADSVGLLIDGGSGQYNFNGPVVVNNPTGAGIVIQSMTNDFNAATGIAASSVRFSFIGTDPISRANAVQVIAPNRVGVEILNNSLNSLTFRGQLVVDPSDLVGAAEKRIDGLTYQGNTIATTSINSLLIGLGALNSGVIIGNDVSNNTGQFIVERSLTINQPDLVGILIQDDDANVTFNRLSGTVDILNRQVQGIRINENRGTVVFNGDTTLNQFVAGLNSTGVELFDNTGNVRFSRLLNINGAQNALSINPTDPTRTAAAIQIQNAAVDAGVTPPFGSVQIGALAISNTTGIGLLSRRGNGLQIGNLEEESVITTLFDSAIDIHDSTGLYTVAFEEVNSTGRLAALPSALFAPTTAIFLRDNAAGSRFAIQGDLTGTGIPLLGSGGTLLFNGHGIWSRNSGEISINAVNFTQNDVGLEMISTLADPNQSNQNNLLVTGGDFTLNQDFGIVTENISNVTVVLSQFDLNGIGIEANLLADTERQFIDRDGNNFFTAGDEYVRFSSAAVAANYGIDTYLRANANGVEVDETGGARRYNWRTEANSIIGANFASYVFDTVDNQTDPALRPILELQVLNHRGVFSQTDPRITDPTLRANRTIALSDGSLTGFNIIGFGTSAVVLDWQGVIDDRVTNISDNEITLSGFGNRGILANITDSPNANLAMLGNIIVANDALAGANDAAAFFGFRQALTGRGLDTIAIDIRTLRSAQSNILIDGSVFTPRTEILYDPIATTIANNDVFTGIRLDLASNYSAAIRNLNFNDTTNFIGADGDIAIRVFGGQNGSVEATNNSIVLNDFFGVTDERAFLMDVQAPTTYTSQLNNQVIYNGVLPITNAGNILIQSTLPLDVVTPGFLINNQRYP